MNTPTSPSTDPASFSALFYGSGLALGLLLLLGLPTESQPAGRPPTVASPPAIGKIPARAREVRGANALSRAMRERRARTAASRP